MIYPKHTPVTAIQFFDRSTKVVMECMNHEGSIWQSKDPFISQWFAHWDNSDAFGLPKVNCDCKADQYWTAEEYHDGKGLSLARYDENTAGQPEHEEYIGL